MSRGESLTPHVTLPPVVDKSGYTEECTLFDNLLAAFEQTAPVTLHPNPDYL